MAFVAECKKNKKIQLCVYSAKQNKRKEIVYGSSVVEDNVEESVSKKLRVLLFIFFSDVYHLYTYLLVFNKNVFNLNLDIRI
jgi:hypothetical protein